MPKTFKWNCKVAACEQQTFQLRDEQNLFPFFVLCGSPNNLDFTAESQNAPNQLCALTAECTL